MSRTFAATQCVELPETTSELLPTPSQLRVSLPVADDVGKQITSHRQTISSILAGTDPRLLLVVGPCSIHNGNSARAYALRLKELAASVADRFFVVMRVYLEKPRTSIGWKGFLYDPELQGEGNIATGLGLSRQLLLDIAEMGVPIATEFLDPSTPQYYSDLISWGCVGARTSSSQIHRQIASGLPMPLGIKNTTSGDIEAAVQAISAAQSPQTHFGINHLGQLSAISTKGNQNAHIVLRGGQRGPNYSPESIQYALGLLTRHGLQRRVLIDCSHDNCGKCHETQAQVFRKVIGNLSKSRTGVIGIMLESHILGGRQPLVPGGTTSPHLSVTDACIGWEETCELIHWADRQLSEQPAATGSAKQKPTPATMGA